MYVHSVKLINYKSIGDYTESEIIIEPRVTAIIGKNESGKSNVLSGLSHIRMISGMSSGFAENLVNRNQPVGTQIKYELILKPTTEESNIGICGDTSIVLSKDSYSLTGAFLDHYLQTVSQSIDTELAFLEEIDSNPFQLRDQDLTNFKSHRANLSKKDSISIPKINAALDFMKKRVDRLPADQREAFLSIADRVHAEWTTLTATLPIFFYRASDKHLNTTYKAEDAEKELKDRTVNPNSLMRELVKVLGVAPDEFVSAVRSGQSAIQLSTRRRINRLVADKITKPFQEFYQTEKIYLELDFNSNAISFTVRSEDGEALMLSERSNGLRWYLDTFIDAQANDISGRNVVYLLDEPGTSLHVNAQKELLKLFNHLSDQGNQIVYTTHSPYMLDTENEGIHRIRAVVKDIEGYTRIYKTAYDARIAPESQHDTLTPIISALGMSLQDTFGPAKDKINIVTEGMSDYIYICTMAKLLQLDMNRYAIIPSVGASNCVNICTILHGWGCTYIAVFDYDQAGVESGGEYMRNKLFLEMNKHYCYMKDISQEELQSKTYKTTKFMVEDVVTQSEINRFCEESNTSKTLNKSLIAKAMSNAIDNHSFIPSEESLENFKALFDRIISYCE